MSRNKKMKKLYIIQTSFSFSKSLVYLPYAAGCLAASAFIDKTVAENYEPAEILFMRDTVENNLDRIQNPDIVAFSNYFWNICYNRELAARIKKKYPDCFIVFGGHNLPENPFSLENDEYIDAVLYGEGETSFTELLKAYALSLPLEKVHGISFRHGKEIITTEQGPLCDLSKLPSPYTSGIFDKIMKENPDIEFHATIETNRGCPYSCAYCEWSFDKKLRFFPLQKVKDEIRWVSEHKIPYCYCADGNFGIAERDIDIANYVVETRRKNGYPNIFKPCYAKESNDTVFKAGRILNEAGADKGITISYQTLCKEALHNIKRENLDIGQFTELSKRYNEIGIPTYSDLILGLPGETFESFAESLCGLMEAGQNNSVTFHHCQVYPNALMGTSEYRNKFKLGLTRVPIDTVHFTPDFKNINEYFYIITSTYSMTRHEWEEANVYGICAEAFHYIGLLRCFAIYLRTAMDVSYLTFYNRLFEYLSSDESTFTGKLIKHIRQTVHHPEKTWAYQKDLFGSTGWYIEEGLFLECVYHSEDFWNDITPFLASFGIEDDIFSQLLTYQKEIIRMPGKNVLNLQLEYDFYNYFKDFYSGKISPLKKKKNILHIVMEKEITAWDEYAREIIWYGKRRSATLATNDREVISIEFTE